MPQGGARGQNLEHLRIVYFSVMDLFVFKEQLLFRVDFLLLLTVRFSGPG